MATYSKSAYAKSLGISNKELEQRAKSAGYSTTEEYYNAKGGAGGGTTGGYEDVMAKQVTSENEFLKRYAGAIAAQPSVSDIYNKWAGTYGIAGLQNTATNLRQSLEDVPQNVATRAKAFGMSAPRIQQRIAAEQANLAPAAQRATEQYQTGVGNVATQLQLEEAQKAQQLTPFTTEASMISDRLASSITGYNAQAKNQLDLLLNKLTTQGALSAAELKQTNDLAILEQTHQNTLKELVAKKNLGGVGDTGW